MFGKVTLSAEAEKKEMDKEVPSLEAVFPCGTVFNITGKHRDVCYFVNRKNEQIALNESMPVNFLTTSLDPQDGVDLNGVRIFAHALLQSALTKSFKVGTLNEERTSSMKAALKEAILKGSFDADTLQDRLRNAETLQEFDWHYIRPSFCQLWYDIANDWTASLYPNIPCYKECDGRTFGSQLDRILAYIGTQELISLRQVDDDTIIDIIPDKDDKTYEGKGYTVQNYDKSVHQGRWLTVFAVKKDWEQWKKDHPKA